jgi:hypothetical protein
MYRTFNLSLDVDLSDEREAIRAVLDDPAKKYLLAMHNAQQRFAYRQAADKELDPAQKRLQIEKIGELEAYAALFLLLEEAECASVKEGNARKAIWRFIRGEDGPESRDEESDIKCFIESKRQAALEAEGSDAAAEEKESPNLDQYSKRVKDAHAQFKASLADRGDESCPCLPDDIGSVKMIEDGSGEWRDDLSQIPEEHRPLVKRYRLIFKGIVHCIVMPPSSHKGLEGFLMFATGQKPLCELSDAGAYKAPNLLTSFFMRYPQYFALFKEIEQDAMEKKAAEGKAQAEASAALERRVRADGYTGPIDAALRHRAAGSVGREVPTAAPVPAVSLVAPPAAPTPAVSLVAPPAAPAPAVSLVAPPAAPAPAVSLVAPPAAPAKAVSAEEAPDSALGDDPASTL